jgi:hypothetical protein
VYRYRCDQCRTTSPVVRTRAEALHERDRHRRQFHGGHIPDGEHLQRRRRRGPAPGEIRPAAVVVVLLALLLLAWATHH